MTELVTKADLSLLRKDMDNAIEHQTLKLTVRLGGLIAIGVAVLASLDRLN